MNLLGGLRADRDFSLDQRPSELELMLRRPHKTKRRPPYSSRSALSGSILAALRAGR
jgi:hypothetical protein